MTNEISIYTHIDSPFPCPNNEALRTCQQLNPSSYLPNAVHSVVDSLFESIGITCGR